MECTKELKKFNKCVMTTLKDIDYVANSCHDYEDTPLCKQGISSVKDNMKRCNLLEQMYKDCQAKKRTQ